MNNEMLTIKDVLEILKKRVIIIATIVAISTITAGIFSWFVIKPVYKSSTKLFIGKEGKQQGSTITEGGEYQSSEVQMYQNLMKTYAEIIKSPDLVERALYEAKLDLEVDAVLNGIEVIPQDKSQIMEVTFKIGNPYDAQKVLEAVNEEFMKTSKKLISNATIEVIIEPKVPANPISPNKKMNLVVAFMAGLMFSVGLSLFLEYLDNSVKTPQDIEKLLGITVIGMVPEIDAQDSKRAKAYRKGNNKGEKTLSHKIKEKDIEKKEVMGAKMDKAVQATSNTINENKSENLYIKNENLEV